MLDLGCGEAQATRYFLDKGVDAYGVDASRVAQEMSRLPSCRFILHDITQGPLPLPHWYNLYDLVWCCEFVEHVEERYLPNILHTFKQARVVAMTHGVPGQFGHHHVNNQPPQYWVTELNRIGFQYDINHTVQSRQVTTPASYWGMSGMIFMRRT